MGKMLEKPNTTTSVPDAGQVVDLMELDLSALVNISDEDLLRLSSNNSHLRFERNADGSLSILSPSGFNAGSVGADIQGVSFFVGPQECRWKSSGR